MGKKTEEKLIVNGKRLDGRLPEETRPIEMKLDVVNRANGSAMVRFGGSVAIAAVYGPRELFPKFMQESETGILRVRYNMAPFSVTDRKNPAPDRRSIELSKVIKLAFRPSVLLEDFSKTTVDVFIEIIQGDGSTRVAGINAASLALAAAGIPMRDLVVACSVGKINDTLVVDLNGKEDNNSESDVAFAFMPSKEKITLLQMDGTLTEEELEKLTKFAVDAGKKIYEMQKKVLKEKYG